MAKVDELHITGTGKWEYAIIQPLGKEIQTHHSIFWAQPDPAELDLDAATKQYKGELFVDDAFFFKGDLPDNIKNLDMTEMDGTSSTNAVNARLFSITSQGTITLNQPGPSLLRVWSTAGRLLHETIAGGTLDLATSTKLQRGYYIVECKNGNNRLSVPFMLAQR